MTPTFKKANDMKSRDILKLMGRFAGRILFGLMLSNISACGNSTLTDNSAFCVPHDFSVVGSAPGVTIYERTWAADKTDHKDYVQVIDLSSGASLEFFHGPIQTSSSDNPLMSREPLEWVWSTFYMDNDQAFCLANAAFFNNDLPLLTTLAYPLKVDGNIVSYGYPSGEDPHCRGCPKMMLHVWENHAVITEYDKSMLCQGSSSDCAPNIIVGNSNNADRRATDLAGRTYVGTGDRQGDGIHELVLLLSTSNATAQQATEILEQSFCASQSMMLDGGGSTQLICSLDPDRPLIRSSDINPRTIPQTIGVLSAASD